MDTLLLTIILCVDFKIFGSLSVLNKMAYANLKKTKKGRGN